MLCDGAEIRTVPAATCSAHVGGRAVAPWLVLLALLFCAVPLPAQQAGNGRLLEVAIDRLNNVDADSAIVLASRVLRSQPTRREHVLGLMVLAAACYPEQAEARDRARARAVLRDLVTRYPEESARLPESIRWRGLDELLREVRSEHAAGRAQRATPPDRRASATPPAPPAPHPARASHQTASSSITEGPGHFLQITEPSAWSGTATRGIVVPQRQSIRVVGVARHQMGVAAIEVNGARAALSRTQDGSLRFVAYVAPQPGMDRVVVVVRGTSGPPLVKEYVVDPAPPSAPAPPATYSGKRWAVVVGISDYQDTAITGLRFADDDARAFHEFLVSDRAGAGGFDPENVLLLLNERATYREIRTALFSFLGRATEDDLVVIYFAGHGSPDPLRPRNLYLLAHDTEAGNLAGSAFPMEDLNRAVESLYARNILVITDACHSGGVGTSLGTRGGLNTINDVFLQQLAASTGGLAVFTASGASQVSLEDARWGGGHGVFTHFLLEALNGAADDDGDQIVTLVEMMEYTRDRVRRETQNAQIPTISLTTYDPYLPVGLVLRRPLASQQTAGPASGIAGPEAAPASSPAPSPAAVTPDTSALAMLEEAVRQFPRSAVYRQELGTALRRAGRTEEALRELHEAVRLDRRSAASRYELGLALRQAARAPDAVPEFEAATQLDRDNATYLHALGMALLGTGRREEALGALRRAVRLTPDNAAFRRDLADALCEASHHRAAVSEYRDAVRLEPANLTYRRGLAGALVQDGRSSEAVTELRDAVRASPGDAETHFELAEALRASGQLADARAAMERAIVLQPAEAGYHRALAGILHALERPFEELRALRQAVRLAPGNAGYHHDLGLALLRAAQPADAVQSLREAVRLDGANAAYHHGLARALKAVRSPREALVSFANALRLAPENARVHFELGVFYQELGEMDQAEDELRQAVRLDGTSREYAEALAATRPRHP